MTMELSLSSLSSAALYTGLAYLQGVVTYSLVAYDIPATSSESNLKKTMDYYTTRKEADLSYKGVPVACVLLTGGVFANIAVQRGSVGSLLTLAAAFLTAFNNGKNVVDPVNALAADAKGDKVKERNLTEFMSGVTRGHWIDFAGFTTIFLLVTYL
ncbi:expressed unknown protein [Seminavis robusta]|uniref:Uncharacterized protein n=1 Tax=Seminavis robusta TaxID=568900 RepID=A0A9N8HZS0_9STRA|nr:expressed unknown protein [Seminavis robusta]|eukprot:Sro3084_g343390.1 n/a (156) ;mRNA; f:8410-8877